MFKVVLSIQLICVYYHPVAWVCITHTNIHMHNTLLFEKMPVDSFLDINHQRLLPYFSFSDSTLGPIILFIYTFY